MKKMKRFLVTLLSSLTAIACIAGITACNDKKEADPDSSASPSINITIDRNEGSEACKHTYGVVYEKAATCTEGGKQYIGCTVCGELMEGVTQDTAPKGHAWDVEKATCTAGMTCTVCDFKVSPQAHTYDDAEVATCTKARDCNVCGYVAKGDEIVPHTMVYAFDTVDSTVTGVLNSMLVGAADITLKEAVTDGANKKAAYIANSCTSDGLENFKFCVVCAQNWMTANTEAMAKDQDALIAWNALSTVEKLQKVFAESYAEGFKTIEAAHTMVNYYGTQEEYEDGKAYTVATANKAGEYVPASCLEKGLKNFKVC